MRGEFSFVLEVLMEVPSSLRTPIAVGSISSVSDVRVTSVH
jgi:hypothetical protein